MCWAEWWVVSGYQRGRDKEKGGDGGPSWVEADHLPSRLNVRAVRIQRRVHSLLQASQPVLLLEGRIGGKKEAAVVLSVTLVELNGERENEIGLVL